MPVFLCEIEHKKYNSIMERSISITDLTVDHEEEEVEAACRAAVEAMKPLGWYEFLWVKCMYSDCAGVDSYGRYYNMTGYECQNRCFWCGNETPGHRRYCQNRKCRNEYVRHYRWQEARDWCRKRYDLKCGECGQQEDSRYDSKLRFAVHHIEPLKGSLRLWNKLNRPENLIWLCGKCHDGKSRKPAPEQEGVDQLELWHWQDASAASSNHNSS